MASKLKVRLKRNSDTLYEINHKCMFGLWRNSQKLLGDVPNRFLSKNCAEQALISMTIRKDIEYEMFE